MISDCCTLSHAALMGLILFKHKFHMHGQRCGISCPRPDRLFIYGVPESEIIRQMVSVDFS